MYLGLILCATTTVVSAHNIYLPLVPLQTHHAASHAREHKWTLQTYSTMHYRTAHEAFIKHGTDTKSLSTLYFNSDDFRLSHIFQNCLAPLNTKNYNPYMRVLRMRPRVTYSEHGGTIGGRIETTLGKKKSARIGVRAELPFKRREVERKDAGSRGPAELQDLKSYNQVKIDKTGGGISIRDAHGYRLDFVEALPANTSYDPGLSYNSLNGNTKIFATTVNKDTGSVLASVARYSPETIAPRGDDLATSSFATTGKTNLPTDLSTLSEDTFYEFVNGTDYSILLDSHDKTVAQRTADQDAKASTWIITPYDQVAGTIDPNWTAIQVAIDRTIGYYNENPYEWFHDRGFNLESDQCVGIGDLTVEGYLDADLTDCFTLHLCGGVIAPTASGRTGANNPYLIHLGNRGHTELFAGGGFDLMLNKAQTFCLSADAKYHKAQKATEKIAATAVGAQIKNMGPEVEADVEWEEVNGNAWLHMTHPHTRTVTCSVGYSFHCKSKDRVSFIESSVESWLGKSYNTTTKKFDVANNLTLDETGAQANTQSIAHVIRSRFSYDISPWVNINAGGAYTIAGKNTPQVTELSAGCVVKF
jgi:hypothetical protein